MLFRCCFLAQKWGMRMCVVLHHQKDCVVGLQAVCWVKWGYPEEVWAYHWLPLFAFSAWCPSLSHLGLKEWVRRLWGSESTSEWWNSLWTCLISFYRQVYGPLPASVRELYLNCAKNTSVADPGSADNFVTLLLLSQLPVVWWSGSLELLENLSHCLSHLSLKW